MPQITRCVPIRAACKEFSSLLARVRYAGDRVVVTAHGRPAAAIVSVKDLRQLEQAKAGSATVAR